MPYFQPNTNIIFGLVPVQDARGAGQTNLYPVSSSEAVAVLPGDCMVMTSNGTLRAAVTADVPGTRQMIGVAAQALTTAEFAQGTLNLLVYDAPNQLFAISATTSASVSTTELGQTFQLCTSSTGTGIPSTAVSRSKHALAPGTASSANMLRLVGILPIDTWSSSAVSTNNKKWIVAPSPVSQFHGNITS